MQHRRTEAPAPSGVRRCPGGALRLTCIALAAVALDALLVCAASAQPAQGGTAQTAPPQNQAPGPAAAAAPAKKAEAKEEKEESLDHRFQFGAAVRVGTGYRVIAPYNEEQCSGATGPDKESICGGLYPVFLELSPSFGVTGSIELLVDFRLFLMDADYTAAKGFYISPGIKFYADAESRLKFFLTAQPVFELQDQTVNAGLSTFDFGLRSTVGLQFDFIRYIGAFIQGGVLFTFSRWLTFVADFSAGIQVRY